MASQQPPSLRRIYITATVCALFAGVYAAMGTQPPGLALLVTHYATPVSAVLWLQRDARLRGVASVYDWGTLMFITWPVAIPWYAIKTRGLPAGVPLAVFLLLPVLVPLLTFTVINAARGR